jgi:hypothetical protein
MSWIRVFLMGSILVLISACSLLQPSARAMQVAIDDYVSHEEDYPREFILAENFVLKNLQKIKDSDPVQYSVNAEFDMTYTVDGDVIVAALDKKHSQEREKEKRRTNNPFEEIKGAITGAVDNFRYESRFKNVRKGDQDHYTGEFTLIRNADNSWRVNNASYQ